MATLIRYSTEPLTIGPDFDLLLLIAVARDVHPNPGRPRYSCSVSSQGTSYLCTRCSHWVHSRCSGLRNMAVNHRANDWICTTCGTPSQPRTPSPPPRPAHSSTKCSTYISGATMASATNRRNCIFLEAHIVKVTAIQESKITVQSRSPNIQSYTLVRQARRLGPEIG